MELRQLRYFLGVVEAGSLLKASGRLHVAQPALGQQIAALEGELGSRLFERTSRGMTLTAAGHRFLDHAKVVLADVDRAREAVREASAMPQGEVAIGLPTTVALSATVPLVHACRERLPQVRLRIVEAYSGFVREWLQAGRVDLAFLYGNEAEPGLMKRSLLDERLALITSAHAPALPARLRLSRLVEHDLVLPSHEHGLRRIIDDACLPHRLSLRVVAEIDSLSSVKLAVERGIGATILPLAAVAGDVAAGRLRASAITDASMLRRLVLVTNATRPATTASTAVTALAVELIHAMVSSGEWPGRWVG